MGPPQGARVRWDGGETRDIVRVLNGRLALWKDNNRNDGCPPHAAGGFSASGSKSLVSTDTADEVVAGTVVSRRLELELEMERTLPVELGLYDLAMLTSVYRVASFIALGPLLLSAAFATPGGGQPGQ